MCKQATRTHTPPLATHSKFPNRFFAAAAAGDGVVVRSVAPACMSVCVLLPHPECIDCVCVCVCVYELGAYSSKGITFIVGIL